MTPEDMIKRHATGCGCYAAQTDNEPTAVYPCSPTDPATQNWLATYKGRVVLVEVIPPGVPMTPGRSVIADRIMVVAHSRKPGPLSVREEGALRSDAAFEAKTNHLPPEVRNNLHHLRRSWLASLGKFAGEKRKKFERALEEAIAAASGS